MFSRSARLMNLILTVTNIDRHRKCKTAVAKLEVLISLVLNKANSDAIPLFSRTAASIASLGTRMVMENDSVDYDTKHKLDLTFFKSRSAASHCKSMHLWNTVQINFNTDIYARL